MCPVGRCRALSQRSVLRVCVDRTRYCTVVQSPSIASQAPNLSPHGVPECPMSPSSARTILGIAFCWTVEPSPADGDLVQPRNVHGLSRVTGLSPREGRASASQAARPPTVVPPANHRPRRSHDLAVLSSDCVQLRSHPRPPHPSPTHFISASPVASSCRAYPPRGHQHSTVSLKDQIHTTVPWSC